MSADALRAPCASGAQQRHTAVPFTAVEFNDGLWAPRQRAVRERTVPFLYGQCEKIGMIEALEVAKPPGPLAYPFKNVEADKSRIVYPPTLKGYHGLKA